MKGRKKLRKASTRERLYHLRRTISQAVSAPSCCDESGYYPVHVIVLIFTRKLKRLVIVDSGIGFTHDEKKSPFERVRTVSQSSRSSTTTPANTVLTIEDDEDGLQFRQKMSSMQQTANLGPNDESGTADYVMEQNGLGGSFAAKVGFSGF